jgi:arsenate reductase (glutaredoxin)
MKKLFYLPSCSTCIRIMKEIGVDTYWDIIDIKKNPITEKEVDAIKEQIGSYEGFFSKRALKYKTMNLKEKKLTDLDYRELILEEYTFIQRPIVFIKDTYFVGNNTATISSIIQALKQ